MTIRTAICDLLGMKYPVMLAGMGGISYAELCAAVSEAGGYGCLGMANVEPEIIRAQMRRVRALTDKPFAVDLLTQLPEKFEASIDVIIEEGANCFIAGLGVPEKVIGRLHRAELKVITLCGTVKHAKKAEQAGCDAVIAQGTEGGGHTGKIGAMALIPQVVDAVKVPVIAAGSIFDGRGLAAALALGAQGVWIGTRFIATLEAHAASIYKDALLKATEEDTVITRCYSGKTMRALRNEYTQEWESRLAEIKPFPEQANISDKAGVLGPVLGILENIDPARDCLPAGQGAGAMRLIVPAREVVLSIMQEAEDVLESLAHFGSIAGAKK